MCVRLLETLRNKGYSFSTVSGYRNSAAAKTVILRHDIDARPGKALEIAGLENELKIRSTFYFKATQGRFDSKLVKEIAGLGHEIGYHYEDLSKSRGSFEKAIERFARNLEELRKICPVTSACMDGHVLSRWNNLDLWKKYNYHDFGIAAEPYLDFNFSEFLYITDTGRKWNAVQYSLYDKVNSGFHYRNKTTPMLIRDLENDSVPDRLMITLHPQRWHNHAGMWMQEAVFQRMKNIVKYVIIKIRSGSSVS
ncbi:MAG TPA: hypothetical protein VMC08_08855 [Bacteroidales bacterium]|nr:hypothetical protein [Bacteroidales bacterium]